MRTKASGVSAEAGLGVDDHQSQFCPIVRSGAWTDIGFRSSMEDVYVCLDNFMQDYGLKDFPDEPNAFYGVFFLPLTLYYNFTFPSFNIVLQFH